MGGRLGRIRTVLRPRTWWQWTIVLAAIAGAAIGLATLGCDRGSKQSLWHLEAPTLEEDGYVVQLSDHQRAECAGAYYTIVRRASDYVGYYPLMDNVPASVNDAGRIAVPADPQVLHVVDDLSIDDMVCGLRWVGAQGDVDRYETDEFRMCAANVSGGFTFGLGYEDTTLAVDVDRRTDDVVASIRRTDSLYPLGEEVTGDQFEYYHAVQYLWHNARGKTRAEDGSLAPITEWPAISNISSSFCSYDKSPRFEMAPVSKVEGTCFLQVVVTDADGNTHGSELVQLKTSALEDPEGNVRTAKTESGELTFRLENDHAVLERYAGEDKTVTVPDTVDGLPVTIVGERAFAGYNDAPFVQEVVLPESVEHIASRAFAGTQLTTFEVPPRLKRLDPGAFSNCLSLTGFVQKADNGITSVRDGVLYSADGSTLLAYPSAKGTEFAVPEGVTTIGPAAFAGSGIQKVTLPESLRVIDACAFIECSHLAEPVFPAGLERIGASAFALALADTSNSVAQQNVAWETVDIGPQVSYVGSGAFTKHKLRAFHVDEQNAWYDDAGGFLVGKDGTLVQAPEEFDGSLMVPDGITTLSSDSLRGYEVPKSKSGKTVQLIDLFLPASLRRIEDDALPTYSETTDTSASGEYKCGVRFHAPRGSWAESYAKEHDIECDDAQKVEQLQWKSVEVPLHKAKLTFRRYDDHAVLVGIDAQDAGHIAIPDLVEGVPVTTIGFDEDDVASGIVKTVVIPHTVTHITEGTLLSRLQYVRKFEVDSRNTQLVVREGAIYSADGTTLVVYPGGRDEEYQVPEGTTVIAARAFASSNVVRVTLPEGLARIEEFAFSGCANLTSISLPSSLRYIGPYAFRSDAKLKVQLNEGLDTVSKEAFLGVESYDSLELSDSVTHVGDRAFSSSTTTPASVATRMVRIGSGLEELGADVFDGLDFDTFVVSPQNEHFKADGPFLLSKDGRTLWACAPTAGPEIRVPDGVEVIGESVLGVITTDLTDVYLPSSVLRISTICFNSSQRESVTLHCAPGSEAALFARIEGYNVVEE